jgi:hypothetical protein
MSDDVVEVVRTIDAPREEVFRALRCSPQGLSKLMSPMVAKTMRSEVAQLDRLRAVLEDSRS